MYTSRIRSNTNHKTNFHAMDFPVDLESLKVRNRRKSGIKQRTTNNVNGPIIMNHVTKVRRKRNNDAKATMMDINIHITTL